MATSPLTGVIRQLRIAALCDGAGLTDGQLLSSFLAHRDEAAFAALVRRHGPMVWGVCRRAVANHHDAEDAFQATFLVLVRKAAAIVPREQVANWLHGVAYNTAIKARALANRRRVRERQVQQLPEPEAEAPDLWRDLQPLLDQELSRLPDLYRVPLVLCDLEGITRKQAARQLGVPEGTLSARLSRARAMLARRLAQRGVLLSSGALAWLLSLNAASARVPAAVLEATIKAATPLAAGAISVRVAAITEGVLKTMFLTRLKIATSVLLLVATLGAASVGVLTLRTPAAETPQEPPLPAPFKPARQKADPRITQSKVRPAAPETPTDLPEQALWKKASVGGKHNVLLKKIEVKADREQYTDFHDYGPWSGTSYAGHEDLPGGYWVYVYPYWYIWGAKDGPAPGDSNKATVGGKYRRLLKKIEAKDDRGIYADFHDYGYSTISSWAGYDDLPAGYWVYVYPHWYIWGETAKEW